MHQQTLYEKCITAWSALYNIPGKEPKYKTPESRYLETVMGKDLETVEKALSSVVSHLNNFRTYETVKHTLEASIGGKEAPSGHAEPV